MYHGSADERAKLRQKLTKLKAVDNYLSYPVVITSYEICMRDQKHIYNLMWKYLIVDEGHRIKNLNCKLIRFVGNILSVQPLTSQIKVTMGIPKVRHPAHRHQNRSTAAPEILTFDKFAK